jgi:glutaredoxin
MLHSASGFASVTLSIGSIFAMHMALPCPHCKQVKALIMQAKMEYDVNGYLMREYMEA